MPVRSSVCVDTVQIRTMPGPTSSWTTTATAWVWSSMGPRSPPSEVRGGGKRVRVSWGVWEGGVGWGVGRMEGCGLW